MILIDKSSMEKIDGLVTVLCKHGRGMLTLIKKMNKFYGEENILIPYDKFCIGKKYVGLLTKKGTEIVEIQKVLEYGEGLGISLEEILFASQLLDKLLKYKSQMKEWIG